MLLTFVTACPEVFATSLNFCICRLNKVVRGLWFSHRILGCYAVSLGKCFTMLSAVILGSSSPRTVTDSVIRGTGGSTPLTPKAGASPPGGSVE